MAAIESHAITALETLAESEPFVYEKLIAQYDKDTAASIAQGLCAHRATTLRVNTLQTDAHAFIEVLEGASIHYEHVPWYTDAFILPSGSESALEALDEYQQGHFYVQNISAMLPALILAPRRSADILDMCAAPGGKTTQIAALTKGEAHICACEMNTGRAERLAFNIARQNCRGVNVMRGDARRLDSFMKFDQILLDAPCTGSGTLNARGRQRGCIRQELLDKTTKSQRQLIKKALELLKPGEDMVYSTCSVFTEENEDIIRYALSLGIARVIPINLSDAYASVPMLPVRIDGCLAVCPNMQYEGFFMAKLRREY